MTCRSNNRSAILRRTVKIAKDHPYSTILTKSLIMVSSDKTDMVSITTRILNQMKAPLIANRERLW